jgi:hypothetical protein
LRFNPDLQQMHFRAGGAVEFAVLDAGAGAHHLHIAASQHPPRAQAILVRQFARNDVGEDLHVAMAMPAETGAGLDDIVVDDPQAAETHVARVVVIREGKAVMRVQPAMVRMAALGRRAQDGVHGGPPMQPSGARRSTA